MVPEVNNPDEHLLESRYLSVHKEMERRSGSLQSLPLVFVEIQRVLLYDDTPSSPTDGQVLQAVAEKLQRSLRATDFLACSGNHRLVVFLPKASTAGANVVATRLREVLSSAEFSCESITFTVKVEVDVASVQAEDTVEAILNSADHQHAPSE
jgi:diguanylate cyclase (GGDEF)-like protein